jgi:hypothetical protein
VAADGQTVVVAGLIARQKTRDVRKVPYLGDLPILGNLFRVNFSECIKRELIIVLTPRIVYSDDDVERVKAEETARMQWCLPDVYKDHGDIYAPAYPSVEGGDRSTDVLGQEIPANLKLPTQGRPRARAAMGAIGATGDGACVNDGVVVPGGTPMVPGVQAAPQQPMMAPTPTPGSVQPQGTPTPSTGVPMSVNPLKSSDLEQVSLNNSSVLDNIRMLPAMELKRIDQPTLDQQAVGANQHAPATDAVEPPPPVKPTYRLMGGISRNPTAPPVANQIQQTGAASSSTNQR